ncbi:universal stress protein [Massilia sp. BJB1822]|uniref:universal stress protein n=1 Tax=Massilia sp. BJB1822 TaxID=2744470 RepID=UPI0015943300|nr:universal stress protein [Massilia sp. BJB1822]NVD97769.1 universal stress protein [Massilia sp. BJB1822]
MFKHILLPTDGTEISQRAIQTCVNFAKSIGATIIGLHVMPEYRALAYEYQMLENTREQFEAECILQAQGYLADITRAANSADVPCETIFVTNDHPFAAIMEQAALHQCDLIAMASHGRRGIKGFLMGSETQKVLTHSTIPVLILR